jgi:cytoskeletal protein CcmA (bactofilin family)
MPSRKTRAADNYTINTIIGPGSFVQGDVKSEGFTRIDGALQGNLHAKGRVVIGENARLRSSIRGTTITIGGVVDGNILASERLVALPTALILGNITTRRLEAGEGCLIHGRVQVCDTEESWNKAEKEYRNKHG